MYKESRNIIFVICCLKPDGGNELGYPTELEKLEEALTIFKFDTWKRPIREEFTSRLTDFSYHTSQSAVSEILTAYEIGQKIGFDKITLHPPLSNGKNGDIVVAQQGRQIFIELTSLNERKSEKKIRAAFVRAAEHLGKKCKPSTYAITLHVDTKFLPKDKDGHIEEELAGKYLEEWMDLLHLDELAGITGYIDFRNDYSWIEEKRYLSELINSNYEFSLQPELVEMMKTQSHVLEWASRVELKSMNRSPFSGVFYDSECRGDFVEIHSDEFYPSPSALAQEQALHNQIAKKIQDKILAKQYHEGTPIILMIREDISDRMFFDEYEGASLIDQVITTELAKSQWISGVVLYSRSMSDGRYLENNNAHSDVRIEYNDLLSLGIRNKSTNC